MEICYKVVYKSLEGNLYSCIAPGIWSLPYHPGVLVKPLIGKLFVFDTLVNALEFLDCNLLTEEVWEAIGENLKPIETLVKWQHIEEFAKYFWKKQDDERIIVDTAPKGSMTSDSLVLTRKVSLGY